MSDRDSFIEEVGEEVRRDRLFGLFRRYGWIAIVVVVLIVAAAGYREWQRGQDRAAAQEFGNRLVSALDREDPTRRIAALTAIETTDPEAGAILDFLVASERAAAGEPAAAAGRLRSLAEGADIPDRYRDLALLRAQMLAPLEHAAAMTLLDELATPGRPYRALAIEQQALSHIREGNDEAAIALLEQVEVDAEATAGLQRRARQVIVALEVGATLAPAEAVADPGGEEDAREGSGAGEGDVPDPDATPVLPLGAPVAPPPGSEEGAGAATGTDDTGSAGTAGGG